MRNISYIFCLLLYVSLQAVCQSLDNAQSAIEINYNTGDYKKAYVRNKSIVKRIRKNTSDTAAFARALINQALICESLYKFSEADTSLRQGLSLISTIDSTDNEKYINLLRQVASYYYQSGNYVKCTAYLDKALRLVKINSKDLDELKVKLAFEYTRVLAKRFYNNEAFLETKNQEMSLIQAHEIGVVDPEAIFKPKNTGDIKSKHIINKYADIINLKAAIQLQRGDYRSLVPILDKNEVWLRTNIGRRNLYYRDHLITLAKFNESKENWDKAIRYYKQANNYTTYKPIEKTGLLIQERLIALNYLTKRRRESVSYKVKMERAIKKNFDKNNVQYSRYKFLEVNQLYQDRNYIKADKKLNDIFISNNNIRSNPLFRFIMLDMKVKLLIKKGIFDEAEDSLNIILQLKSDLYGENSPEYNREKLRLADFYSTYTNKFAVAAAIQENSFNKSVEPQLSTFNPEYFRDMQQIANTYELTERYDLAIKYLSDAAEYIKNDYGTNHIEYAIDLEKWSTVLAKKGDYAKAEELIQKAVNIFKQVSNKNNEENKSAAYLSLAKLYNLLGRYDEAEDALGKANKFSKRSNKKDGASVKSLDELAALYIKQGRYNEAQNLLEGSVKRRERQFGKNSRELIPGLNLLGNVFIITGNYSEANNNIQRSISITQNIFGDSSIKYTESLTLLESLYKELGDYKKSEEIARQILRIQRKQLGNNHIEIANSLTRFALIKLFNDNNLQNAEKMLNEALQITKFNLGDKHPQYAEQLKNMALIYINEGKFSKGDSLLDQAAKIWSVAFGKINSYTAEVALIKGNIAYKKGEYIRSLMKYNEAKVLYRDVFSSNHPGYVAASGKLARAYYMAKDYANSLKELNESTEKYLDFIKKYFPSLSFSEKSKYWNTIKDDFEFFNSLAIKVFPSNPQVSANMYNNIISTKALLLSSSIKMKQRILNSKDEKLIAKFNLWSEKKQYLLLVAAMNKEQQIVSNADPQRIEKEINQLEKELSQTSELFANSFDKKDYKWKDIRKVLKNNEYAVEIIRFRQFNKEFTDTIVYAALILSKQTDKAPKLVLFDEGNEMESKYIKYYKNAVILKSTDDSYSFNAYWKPIKDQIPDNATIYISNEGVFNELNIETIQVGADAYVIDKNPVNIVSNTKDIIQRKNKSGFQIGKAVFIGNPTFYLSSTTSQNVISQLPGTEAEVNEIDTLFLSHGWKTKKFIRDNADEDSLKLVKNPKILHIATHGYFKADDLKKGNLEQTENIDFSRNPLLNSGLLVKSAGDVLKTNNALKINNENGVLTAYEAMDLSLDNTDLVVLSACETGRGEVQIGEGVFGLQRSFLVAGSDALIMTLFKVDDAITKDLMNTFYLLWFQSGKMREAFLEAKRQIKDRYGYPVYWGSFVMIGGI